MNETIKMAPIVTDALVLAEWMVQRLGPDFTVLARDLVRTAIDLAVALGFAYKNRDRESSLLEADDLLLRLRILSRMAGTAGVLEHSQMLFVLERTNVIGKQLGGWIQSLK